MSGTADAAAGPSLAPNHAKKSRRENELGESRDSPKKPDEVFVRGSSGRRRPKKRTLITIEDSLTSDSEDDVVVVEGARTVHPTTRTKTSTDRLNSSRKATKRLAPGNEDDVRPIQIDKLGKARCHVSTSSPLKKAHDPPVKLSAATESVSSSSSRSKSPTKQTKLVAFPSRSSPKKLKGQIIQDVIDLTIDSSRTKVVKKGKANESVARMPSKETGFQEHAGDDKTFEKALIMSPIESERYECVQVRLTAVPGSMLSSESRTVSDVSRSPLLPKKLFNSKSKKGLSVAEVKRKPRPPPTVEVTAPPVAKPASRWQDWMVPDSEPICDILKRFHEQDPVLVHRGKDDHSSCITRDDRKQASVPGVSRAAPPTGEPTHQWKEWSVPDSEPLDQILTRFNTRDTNRPLSFHEFRDLFRECDRVLEYAAEGEFLDGNDCDYLDYFERKGRCILKKANSKLRKHDGTQQGSAMYGRILFPPMDVTMREIMKLKPSDIFIDIGHGVGNACLQAAYTFGCEARGIEVDTDRHWLAEEFESNFQTQFSRMELRKGMRYKIGKVDLRKGDLTDVKYRQFVVDVDVGFCNNFNYVFAEKSSKSWSDEYFLDDHLAGIFCLMKPDAMLVTLGPLPIVAPAYADAKRFRERAGLEVNSDLSFYDLDEFELQAKDRLVSWNTVPKDVKLYRYTRRKQRQKHATFMCCNPKCDLARGNKTLKAYFANDEGYVLPVVSCKCKFTPTTKRRETTKLEV